MTTKTEKLKAELAEARDRIEELKSCLIIEEMERDTLRKRVEELEVLQGHLQLHDALKARDEAMGMAARLRAVLEFANGALSGTDYHKWSGKGGPAACREGAEKMAFEALSTTQPISDWLAARDAEVRAKVLAECAEKCGDKCPAVPPAKTTPMTISAMKAKLEARAKEAGK